MNLKRAETSDLPEIVELTNLAFRGNVGWTMETKYIEGERINLKMLEENLSANPEALLLIWRDEEDGSLLGSVWLEPRDSALWYMGLLAVRPEMQGRQLGRRMLEASEHALQQQGAARITITVVNKRTRLMEWYERRGYLKTGETKPFPYGDDRVGRPLLDDLEFIVMEKTL
jgi:ribosomal protein S18 acetylase RimI-like enzyme